VEKSIQRLGVEAIDLLQLHSPDTENLRRDDPWESLESLKKEGKIRYAGWSVQSFRENAQAFILDQYHHLIDCIQVRYNLIERDAENTLFPKAIKYGIGVIVRIPLLFGFLTGKFNKDSRFSDDDHRRMNLSPQKLAEYLEKYGYIHSIFDRYPDDSKAVTSLRFCISHPACHVAIPGAKTPEQVEENCLASDLGPIPQDLISQIPK